MAEPPKFYLDVHIPRAVEKALLRLGADVVCGQDVLSNRTADPDHLTAAIAEGRVLVSQDSDFPNLGYGFEHWGIVKLSQQLSIGTIVEDLTIIFRTESAEAMRNRVEYF